MLLNHHVIQYHRNFMTAGEPSILWVKCDDIYKNVLQTVDPPSLIAVTSCVLANNFPFNPFIALGSR